MTSSVARLGTGTRTLEDGRTVPDFAHIGDDPGHTALIVTAEHCLAEWAWERLRAAGITNCAETADVAGALMLATELRPHICLLDVALPGGALTALERICERVPTTRVVMLAPSADDPALLAAVTAGASGCMVGTPDGPALGRALADVLAGHTTLPRALLTRLVAALGPA